MEENLKQLLLIDLCARLPYGVKVKYLYWDENKGCEYPVPMILDDINSDGYIRFHGDIAEGEGRGMLTQYLPYLRPMSSMTEEEKRELQSFFPGSFGSQWLDIEKETIEIFECPSTMTLYLNDSKRVIDFFNSHHIDYLGFIEDRLALEAPEDMYKTK